jgi:hypothetical protein
MKSGPYTQNNWNGAFEEMREHKHQSGGRAASRSARRHSATLGRASKRGERHQVQKQLREYY